VVDDLVLLPAAENVAVDRTVVGAGSWRSTSLLTGESDPVTRSAGDQARAARRHERGVRRVGLDVARPS
jgi:cation transport ATPase